MLTQLCQYLRNWFVRSMIIGNFIIENGEIKNADGTALPLLRNQYYRIIGSVFNDGVRQYEADALTDEPVFNGAVWLMAVPPEVVELAAEIETWVNNNSQALNSPYASESFGGYSYTMKSGNANSGGNSGFSWQSQFAYKLDPWRKI